MTAALTRVIPVANKRSPDCQGVRVISRPLVIAIGVYKRRKGDGAVFSLKHVS